MEPRGTACRPGSNKVFIEVPDVLNAAQVARMQEIAAKAKFVDGRVSNPHNQAKRNLQIDHKDPLYQESTQTLADAMMQNEAVKNFTFMMRFAPPLMCRYQPDMTYGKHSDSAFLNLGQTPFRSDVSSTIFLVEPDTYEGGELTIHLGSKTVRVKGQAGSAVLYPSTTIHEVAPVTSGERLVAITFIQSQIIDEHRRYLLYQLKEIAALEGYNMKWDNRVMLQHVCESLHRMWST